jgi:hypothetical protein
MGAVAKGNTKATELIFGRVIEAIKADKFDYPNDATFIAADLPDFGQMMQDALREERPIVVVFSDGAERIIPALSTCL